MSDRDLKAYDRAVDGRRALKLIRETCEVTGLHPRRLRELQVVRHRRGRRLVMRYVVEFEGPRAGLRKQTVYGKLYRGRRGERTERRMRFLESLQIPTVCFPRVLGYNQRRRFLLVDAMGGGNMADLLWTDDAHVHIGQLGRSLAALHNIGIPSRKHATEALTLHDRRAEVDVLDVAKEKVETSSLSGTVKMRFRSLWAITREDLIHGMAARRETAHGVIHRDLHPDQIRILDSEVGFLDLDEVALGEAELDTGNLLAHLILDDLQAFGVIGQAPLLGRCFLDAYCSLRPVVPERLAGYAAAALLRLVSLRRVSRSAISVLGWDSLARALLDAAASIAGGDWFAGVGSSAGRGGKLAWMEGVDAAGGGTYVSLR
jgi:hypothetical protein